MIILLINIFVINKKMSSNNENSTNLVIDSSNNEVDLKVENNESCKDDSCCENIECNDNCCNESECQDNCCNDGFDSDSEEYHQFIDNMQKGFSQMQILYKAFCKENNRPESDTELMAFMDILQGGSGQMICLAGEDELTEDDKKYVKTLDEFNAEQTANDSEKEKQNDNQ